MRRPSRRDFVKLALGTGASAWLAGCRRRSHSEAAATRDTGTGPRYWVQILLSGGHDTLFTTDPKVRADVDDIVTLPQDNKIATAGDLRLGPHFAPLAKWGSELAFLNGVQVRTVNHETGQKQFFHLKTNIADGRPTLLDVLASHRTGQPLGVAYLNVSSRTMHSPAFFGTADKFYFGKGDVFEELARSTPDELHILAKVMRRQASGIAKSGAAWREAEQTAAYYNELGDFFDKVATVPPLTVTDDATDYTAHTMAETIERAVWLLEHDLCAGVICDLGLLGWDTHIRNEAKQAEMSGTFVKLFDWYLANLHAKKNAHGVLADRTVTIVGSDLGRFPHMNDMLGKDHLPQTGFMFAGPGLRRGRAFGHTGRRMEGLPIAYSDGALADAGRVPVLDDIGTTLLHHAGLDPERYGYGGRVCDFLLDKT